LGLSAVFAPPAPGVQNRSGMAKEFYATVAQASFTLLGLWWVLLQIRHDAWFGDVAYRRGVYDISLYFLLPGMMSLGSLLAIEEPTIWRVSFAIMGVLGVIESALLIAGMRGLRDRGPLAAVADWVSLVVYAVIVLVALWRGLPQELGLGLLPLQVEGILVTILLFLGITLGASLFVTTGPVTAPAGEPPRRGG
jgi:hypothetical protein